MRSEYDVIVVGAGIAGLMCGNFLARGGKRVLILEHNHQPGGLMAGIRRKGFYFDCGDQSMESSGILFPLLNQLGLYDSSEWERAMYRLIIPGGMDHVITDLKETGEALADVFPQERDGIREMFGKLTEFSEMMLEMNKKGAIPYTEEGLTGITGFGRMTWTTLKNRRIMKELFSGKIDDLVTQYIKDPETVKFFTGMGYKGMATFMGAGFWHMWVHDYWYPRKGIQSLMDLLAENFTKLGGTITYRQRVRRIKIHKIHAAGVETVKGDVFRAPRVVFTGDMTKLYGEILPRDLVERSFLKKILTAPVAEPLVSLFLGLDIPPEKLREYLKVHHTFYIPRDGAKDLSRHDDPEMHKGTWVEINAPGLENPGLAPDGHSGLTIQCMTSYHWMNRWEGRGDDFARSKKYSALKERVANDMIDTLANVIPDVRDHIVYQDVGTPLSTIRFTLNKEGGSCAFTMDPEKAPFSRQPMQFRTPVLGLYTAGQWALWPGGVVGAALAGKIVAARILSGFYRSGTDRVYQMIRKRMYR